MATKSRVVEKSFRLGSGRYIQENGAITLLGEEIARLGCKKPFILGGRTALSITKDAMLKSLSDAGMESVVYEYVGFCNVDHCDRIVASQAFSDCDCVVGVGGGNLMDAAKLCAALSSRPVINVPTSSATCAAYTPLSVCYNEIGQTVGSKHLKEEVNVILADMDILCRQPVRLMLSGVYDSLAKLVETRQRLLGKTEDEVDIGLRSSFVLSEFIFDRLISDLPTAAEDVKAGRDSKAVYDTVYLTIAVTGVISGLARGSNQCAIAHKIYEATRTLYTEASKNSLHGEMVGIGLRAQMIYNGDADQEPEFTARMERLGVPTRLSQIGVPAGEETVENYYQNVVTSSAMTGTGDQEKALLRKVLAEII